MMNILSLFDGMSCGMIALERAGIPVTNYYASEIDKHAQIISQKNYPDIIRLGDVTKWQEWDLPKIDMVIGGSPCQGFSMAGKRLNFDDPRSKLFFTFVDILKAVKPKYFLLENVEMREDWEALITQYMGIAPIKIDSALVSAQSRTRYYWTNIGTKQDMFGFLVPNIAQPTDKKILLKDILEHEGNFKFLESPRIKETKYKTDYYVQWDISGKGYYSQQDRAFFPYWKMGTLSSSGGDCKANICIDYDNNIFRRCLPIEAERLQTVPDNYTEGGPDSKRFYMLGNGWTVDVIAHIFSYLPPL